MRRFLALLFAASLAAAANAETLTVVSGADSRPPYISGNWYPVSEGAFALAGAGLTGGTIRAFPFLIRRSITISDLAAKVTTLHAANNFQLAIYANNPATGRPTGSQLAATGDISSANAVVVSGDIVGANVTLAPGLYWGMANCSSNTIVLLGIHTGHGLMATYQGTSTLASVSGSTSTASIFLTTPVAFGTWGDLSAATWTEVFTTSTPFLWMKAA